MKDHILRSSIILTLNLIACLSPNQIWAQSEEKPDVKSHIAIFEIPATDISRAVNFYQEILDIPIERLDFPELKMGLLPYEGQLVTGVIMEGEGYEPSVKGVTIYLNAGDDLQIVLDKVEENGGKIIIPKTPHADNVGFFALFLDSEGNKMGLHSPN